MFYIFVVLLGMIMIIAWVFVLPLLAVIGTLYLLLFYFVFVRFIQLRPRAHLVPICDQFFFGVGKLIILLPHVSGYSGSACPLVRMIVFAVPANWFFRIFLGGGSDC